VKGEGWKMRPHENLEVWKKSIDFVIKVYRITNTFPVEEKFGLVNQLRRASVSVAVNIAEGAARQTNKEFVNFLYITRGSLSEIETELVISRKLGFLSDQDFEMLALEIDAISRMLSGLIKRLRSNQT